MIKTNGIAETALTVADLPKSAQFYRELFGFEPMLDSTELCALAVPGNAVLLLFKAGCREEPIPTPGGVIPPHGASGHMHLSFKVSRDALESCRRELEQRGVAIESQVDWPPGGTSIYFRDPDDHLIELMTPGVWDNY
jgi:catechol 2,3-dioxygenase-like lactoylglutathione lyase family enzyme